MDSQSKCVKDAHGNCSRWCDHREGKAKKVADEVIPTLVRGGRLHYVGGDFDVKDATITNTVTDRRSGMQALAVTVILTRPIPLPMKENTDG